MLFRSATNDAALRVVSDVTGEGILRQLFDAQRDALALWVDGQHHRLKRVALLVIAHGLFARRIPADIRQVYQAVDVARQADEDAEVGDRLDGAADAIAAVVVLGELLPRIGLALLKAQRDAATLLVDIQHHDLDLLTGADHLGRVDVLVGPVHFGNVHQTFHAVFDFHEGAVVGDVGDLAEQIGRAHV